MTDGVYTGIVPPVARGERKPGQKMITFYVPEAEFNAAKEAIAYLDANKPAGSPRVTMTTECREALQRMVKRVDRKRAGQ